MNCIHAEARKGLLSTQDMGRYVAFYNQFAGMFRDGILEERLQKLEEMQGLAITGDNNGISKQQRETDKRT